MICFFPLILKNFLCIIEISLGTPRLEMYRVNVEDPKESTMSRLVHSALAGVIDSDDKSFQTILDMQRMEKKMNQIAHTPDMVRVLNQLEFNFIGVVDATKHKSPEKLLKNEWFDSTFVISDYTQPREWLRKAALEASRGKTIVVLIPARTNTAWFHEYVLGVATDVRFIRGMLTMSHKTKPNTCPDCLAIFQNIPKKRQTNDAVKILNCHSSFTENKSDWSITSLDY